MSARVGAAGLIALCAICAAIGSITAEFLRRNLRSAACGYELQGTGELAPNMIPADADVAARSYPPEPEAPADATGAGVGSLPGFGGSLWLQSGLHGEDFAATEVRFQGLSAAIYRALDLEWEDIPVDMREVYSVSELRRSLDPQAELARLWQIPYVREMWLVHQDLFLAQANLSTMLDRVAHPDTREQLQRSLDDVRYRLHSTRLSIWSESRDPAYRWLYELDRATR